MTFSNVLRKRGGGGDKGLTLSSLHFYRKMTLAWRLFAWFQGAALAAIQIAPRQPFSLADPPH